MMGDLEQLRRLSDERVPCPEGFAVPEEVWNEVRHWPIGLRAEIDRIDEICSSCLQSVVPVSNPMGVYHYTDQEREGLVLAHLIQVHGWTREGRRNG